MADPARRMRFFAAALLLTVVLKFWLATRQMRHVARHSDAVPAAFAGTVPLESHRKAARYTLTKGSFGLWTMAFSAAVLVGWTLLGGLGLLNDVLLETVRPRFGGMAYQLALLTAFTLIGSLLEVPFDLYSTFRIEQAFGFNRMTWKLYLADAAKGLLLGMLIGLPLAAGMATRYALARRSAHAVGDFVARLKPLSGSVQRITSPDATGSVPLSARRSDVFPAPFAPTMATRSPTPIFRLISSRISFPPISTRTLRAPISS